MCDLAKLLESRWVNENNILEDTPVIWRRFGDGFCIMDLREGRFEEALDMLKMHYISTSNLHKTFKIAEEPESVQCFLDRALYHMKNRNSLIATDESFIYSDTGKENKPPAALPCIKQRAPGIPKGNPPIVAVLVTRVITKLDLGQAISRMSLIDGYCLQNLTRFKASFVQKFDAFSHFHCDRYIQLYYLCIHPKYRHRDLGSNMMKISLDRASRLGVQAMIATFDHPKLEKIGESIGLNVIDGRNSHEMAAFIVSESHDKCGNQKSDEDFNYVLMGGCILEEPLPEMEVVATNMPDSGKKKGKKKKGKKDKKGKKKKK